MTRETARLALRRSRLLPRTRNLAKRAWVRWDVALHRNDPSVRQWLPVFTGARSGHIVVPSRALASSRGQTMDFVRHDLVHRGDRVLDVGAGNGRLAVGMLEIGVSSYVGLEIDAGSVEHATHAFAGHPSVRFDLLDVHNPMYNPRGAQLPEEVTFPYGDGSFEFAAASSLYTHLERIEVVRRYVGETARVLAPRGAAFMSFFRSPPNPESASAVRSAFAEAEITAAVEEHFVVEDVAGGSTTAFHDQWMLYLRRRPVG